MVAVGVSFLANFFSLESTRVLIGADVCTCTWVLVFLLVFSLFWCIFVVVMKRQRLSWCVLS